MSLSRNITESRESVLKIWNNPDRVKFTPIIARCGFEVANIGFILRMFQTHSSRDQSLLGWSLLLISLLLWVNFYRVCTPEQKIARYMSIVAALTNLAVFLTVIYFRVR